MPRQSTGPHLWLRKERVDKRTGKLISRAQWIIIDAGKHISTRCSAGEGEGAQKKLAEYIGQKYQPQRRERDIEAIDVADVLAVYDKDTRDSQVNKAKFDERVERLGSWWGGKTLADVSAATCREYTAWRKAEAVKRHAERQSNKPRDQRTKPPATAGQGGARRDLEDLRAAVNHHARKGYHRGVVIVELPQKGLPRDRWLTRQEAAKLLWIAWRTKEVQTRHRGAQKGQALPTEKYPLRHLARFILCGLYTGTRAAAIASASPKRMEGRSWVDLEQGVFHRLPIGARQTTKRQPPVRLPSNLLSHLRRWEAKGIAKEYFVEWRGKPVASVKTAFATAVRKAGIEPATPHSLRHTAATWLMQNGVDLWSAAGFLGMSVQMLERTYGHHHPDFQKQAAAGFRPRRVA